MKQTDLKRESRIISAIVKTGDLLLPLIFALVIGSLFTLICGANPIELYGYIFRKAFLSLGGWFNTLGYATPIIITGIIFALMPIIFNFPKFLGLLGGETENIELFLGGIILFPIGLFAGYFFYSIGLLIRLIAVGSSQSSGKWGTIGSRAKFEQRMRQYSPEFSFEYFTSKAISLIKTVVYAKNEQELLFYKGEQIDPWFKDIIDLNYGGALGVLSVKEENGLVTITTDAFFDVLYDAADKIKFKRARFRAVFQRRNDIPIDMGFSMTKIQCPTCGGSYNAVQNKFSQYNQTDNFVAAAGR